MKLTVLKLVAVVAVVALANANVRAVTPVQKHVNIATSALPYVVAVISDHYTDQDEFDNDVKNFFERGLLAQEYYEHHKAELDVYSFYVPLQTAQSDYGFDVETPSQNCMISWSEAPGTDGTLSKLLAVIDAAGTTVAPDHIVVIGDHPYSLGCTNGEWTYVAEDAASTDILPHEMGHAIATLKDEWFFPWNQGVSHPGIPDNMTRNCFDTRPPETTPPWLRATFAPLYPGAGSYAGCDFFELDVVHAYPPHQNGNDYCLMGAIHGAKFCPVCYGLMEERFLDRIADAGTAGETDGPTPGERIPTPPPNQPVDSATRKPIPPRPPSEIGFVKAAFVQQPAPGTTKPVPKGAPSAIAKPVPARPILQLVVSFDPTNGQIIPKKGSSITARYAPSHRRLGEWAYEIINTDPTLKPQNRVIEVGVLPSNLFRSNSYQGGAAHQSTGAHVTDVIIQIPDIPIDYAKTGIPDLQINIYRLSDKVTARSITKNLLEQLKSSGDAKFVDPPLVSKAIRSVM